MKRSINYRFTAYLTRDTTFILFYIRLNGYYMHFIDLGFSTEIKAFFSSPSQCRARLQWPDEDRYEHQFLMDHHCESISTKNKLMRRLMFSCNRRISSITNSKIALSSRSFKTQLKTRQPQHQILTLTRSSPAFNMASVPSVSDLRLPLSAVDS